MALNKQTKTYLETQQQKQDLADQLFDATTPDPWEGDEPYDFDDEILMHDEILMLEAAQANNLSARCCPLLLQPKPEDGSGEIQDMINDRWVTVYYRDGQIRAVTIESIYDPEDEVKALTTETTFTVPYDDPFEAAAAPAWTYESSYLDNVVNSDPPDS